MTEIYKATFTNPKQNFDGSGGASAAVPCRLWDLGHADRSTSQLTILINTDVNLTYGAEKETTDSNPVQQKSTCIITKSGTTFFTGEVKFKREIRTDSGVQLAVTLQGPDGCLLDTFCNFTSLQEWTLKSDFVKVTELPLQESNTFGSFVGSTLWPDPDDATGAKMFIQDADVPQDTPAGTIGDADTEITLSNTNQGFASRGWLKIVSDQGTNWANYDGYENSTGAFICRNVNQGELDAGAAINHLTNITVYNKIVKQMAPVTVILENDPGAGFVRLRQGGDYSTVPALGCFVLQGMASGTYRATYSVYDFDKILNAGSTTISLSDIIQRMNTADAGFGGAGFNHAADNDFTHDAAGNASTAMQDLAVTKYDYSPDSKPKDAWNAINQVIQSVALEEVVRFWYDHQAEKFRLGELIQGTPVQTITGVVDLNKELDISNVFSTVRVKYVKDQSINLVDPSRSWHSAADGVGVRPDTWIRVSEGGDGYLDPAPSTTTSNAAGNFGMDMLVDLRKDTKLKGDFTHDPTGPFEFGHFWWGPGVTPDPIDLDKIKLRVNSYRVIEDGGRNEANTDFSFFVKVQGTSDYDTTINDSASATWFDLGVDMTGIPTREGKSVEAEWTDFIERNVNAVRIVFDYMAGPVTAGEFYWGVVHEFLVNGNTTKWIVIQTSDTVDDDPLFVKATNTHKKLRGGLRSTGAGAGAGVPRSIDFPGVASSEASAITIGRFFLLILLLSYQLRTFEYPGELASIPQLYQTITVTEETGVSYTGLVMDVGLSNTEGVVSTRLSLWNNQADVISI